MTKRACGFSERRIANSGDTIHCAATRKVDNHTNELQHALNGYQKARDIRSGRVAELEYTALQCREKARDIMRQMQSVPEHRQAVVKDRALNQLRMAHACDKQAQRYGSIIG